MANEKKYTTIEVADTLDVEFGATAEQLLPLIETNNKLATTVKTLAEQVLPTIASGLQSKEVTPTDIEQVVRADDGYLGLSKVTIAATEKDVRIVNRRVNDSDYLYYMEDIAATYQRSDYAVCVAGEFNKDADTLILSGADAYLTSDGDFYTSGTTHTWHDFDDIHGNRWVVYYFVEGNNNSNFMIADATACPIVLAIKGHLGAIIANITVPIQDIVLLEYSDVLDIRLQSATWQHSVVIGDFAEHTEGSIIGGSSICRTAIINVTKQTGGYIVKDCSNLTTIRLPRLTTATLPIIYNVSSKLKLEIPTLTTLNRCNTGQCINAQVVNLPNLESVTAVIIFSESCKEILIPKMRNIIGLNGIFQFVGYSALRKFVLGSVENTFNLRNWSGAFPYLIHFEFGADGGAGLSASENLSAWTCASIDLTGNDMVEDNDKFTTNKEQLLYNFKTYMIERLQNRTDESKLTLTIGANLYNIVTQDKSTTITNGLPYGEWLTAKLAEINWSLASA